MGHPPNRLSKADQLAGVTSNFSYDPLYQLTGVTQGPTTTESYTYDAVGNRLSSLGMSPYQYNSSNELTSTPTATYTYDKNGELKTKVDSTGTTTYNWDTTYRNLLTSIVLPGTGGTVSFRYDPFGRRIQKSGPAGTTNYLYDGPNPLEEVDQNGNVLGRYAQGPGIDEPLSMVRAGTTSYYEADALGSVTSLSNSSGALANTYAYDSYGKQTGSTGTIVNPLQFTGREFDLETSIYEYRARYYDPNIGRFISEDPIGFKGGINFYAYALSSPMNWRDPSGLDVTVYLYPGAAGQGHVGVAVNSNQSVGFYPLSDWGIFWGPGLVKPDTRTPVDGITIPTTAEQDAAVQQYLNDHMGLNNGNYSLTSRNCARFVENSLNAGGISALNTILPWALMEDLHNRYDPRPAVNTSIPLGGGVYYQPALPIE